MSSHKIVHHTRGRLHRHQFEADDVGPTRAQHRPSANKYERRNPYGPVPDRVIDRMLRGACGEPWTATHAKLSEHFNRRTYIGALAWQHIDREVDECAFIGDDGLVYHEPHRHSFYVHPTSGILREIHRKRYRHRPKPNPDQLVLDANRVLMREQGIWYIYTYAMAEKAVAYSKRAPNPDPVAALGAPYVWEPAIRYAMVRALQSKHQLNRKELAHAGLTNGGTRAA